MCDMTIELETNHFMEFDLTYMLSTNTFTTNNRKTSYQKLNLIKLY